MPEGPTLKKWATMTGQFLGRKIVKTGGNTKKVDLKILQDLCFTDVQVHGKQMFLKFETGQSKQPPSHIWLRYHFGMWGTLRVNELKTISNSTLYRARYIQDPKPRVVLNFERGEFLAFYGCSVQQIDTPPILDDRTDVLQDSFNTEKSISFLRQEKPVCYLLLNQRHFAGVGNIVKNEALYSARVHPMQMGTSLSAEKALELVKAARNFAKTWVQDGTAYSPMGTLTIYCKKTCPQGHKVQRDMLGYGEFTRITYWCSLCQPLHSTVPPSELEPALQLPGTSGEKNPDVVDGSPNLPTAKKYPIVMLTETGPGSNIYA